MDEGTSPQPLDDLVRVKEAAERLLLSCEGVHAVEVGYREVGGQRTSEIVIRVAVSRKRPLEELSRPVPSEVLGVPVDVIERSIPTPGLDATVYDPIPGGATIVQGAAAGTAGCRVIDVSTGLPLLLTNWHVVQGDVGASVSQPSGGDVFGTVARVHVGPRADCAVISPNGSREISSSIVGIGPIQGSATTSLGATLRKRGAASEEIRSGTVTAVASTITVGPFFDGSTRQFTNQIVVDGIGEDFADPGDSGSVVVDTEERVVGLYFAGHTGPTSYLNPIVAVQEELSVYVEGTVFEATPAGDSSRATGRVWVGGEFSTCPAGPCSGLAMFDGTDWHAYGGASPSGSVMDIAADYTGGIYITGNLNNWGGYWSGAAGLAWNLTPVAAPDAWSLADGPSGRPLNSGQMMRFAFHPDEKYIYWPNGQRWDRVIQDVDFAWPLRIDGTAELPQDAYPPFVIGSDNSRVVGSVSGQGPVTHIREEQPKATNAYWQPWACHYSSSPGYAGFRYVFIGGMFRWARSIAQSRGVLSNSTVAYTPFGFLSVGVGLIEVAPAGTPVIDYYGYEDAVPPDFFNEFPVYNHNLLYAYEYTYLQDINQGVNVFGGEEPYSIAATTRWRGRPCRVICSADDGSMMFVGGVIRGGADIGEVARGPEAFWHATHPLESPSHRQYRAVRGWPGEGGEFLNTGPPPPVHAPGGGGALQSYNHCAYLDLTEDETSGDEFWSAMGTWPFCGVGLEQLGSFEGTNGSVMAVEPYDGGVFVGGCFNWVGPNIASTSVAYWHPDLGWSAVGDLDPVPESMDVRIGCVALAVTNLWLYAAVGGDSCNIYRIRLSALSGSWETLAENMGRIRCLSPGLRRVPPGEHPKLRYIQRDDEPRQGVPLGNRPTSRQASIRQGPGNTYW